MASVYVTKAGDALDLICFREYGTQAGVAEQVLEVNPHIRENAHRLPSGVDITLPDLDVQSSSQQPLRLWE